MTSVFLNIGESFQDSGIKIFRDALKQTMEVVSFDYAGEKLQEINRRLHFMDIYYLETNMCAKNKNYIIAYRNLIESIITVPNTIYLLPYAPNMLVSCIKKKWPNVDVYIFDYLNLKPSVKI